VSYRGLAVRAAWALAFLAPPSSAETPILGVAQVVGADLGCLRGRSEDIIAVFACGTRCEPIPWQLDERAADGRWALTDGPEPNPDDSPASIDDDDVMLWMVGDAGARDPAGAGSFDADCVVELAVEQGGVTAWVYAVAARHAPARRAARRYVEYDAERDLVLGAHVALGFGAATPRYLAVRAADGTLGPNLLDRLKVRASARFLGLIPLGRDEDDIEWRFAAWRAGPIRVLRREYQWIRLGWGLRTPIFETESLVTRDTVEMPVRLRLNFPPTFFFGGIEVQAVLDFRDLRGWRVAGAGVESVTVGDGRADLDRRRSDWIALSNDSVTLVLALVLGESLASLEPTLVYREADDDLGPEEQRGEMPGVGFRLTQWTAVDRGEHGFAATAYALPAGVDLERFTAQRASPVRVRTTVLRGG